VKLDAQREAIQEKQGKVLEDVLHELEKREALAIVKAPPGSGKTTLLTDAAARLAKQKWRVAIAAQTNSQADDIATRLFEAKVGGVIRLAGGSDPNVPRRVAIETKSRELPHGPCVVVATVKKWEYGELSPFDVVFVDEAWQMTWSSFLALDRVAGRFVLIGDPGQIPPVVTIDTSFWETTPRAPHLAAPELLLSEQKGTVLSLPASRRLPLDSVDAVQGFYDFPFDAWAKGGDRVLNVSGPSKTPLDAAIDRLTTGSMVGLTLPTPPGGAPPAVDHELADTAVEIARRLLERSANTLIADEKNPKSVALVPDQIGFCATHRVMNARIEELRPAKLAGARVDTAERWQGLQRHVMIVVHPLSGLEEPSSFDLETGRLCVMASRHRVGLVILAREGVGNTHDGLIVSADQAVGRADANGRGHARHRAFWNRLADQGRCVAA
jgi:hypothetical protein